MEVIYKNKKGEFTHILCNDHIPNSAFINEFQTTQFNLKLESIEVYEKEFQGYEVNDGGVFLLLYVDIKNHANEKIHVFKDDFLFKTDCEDPFYAEDNFNIQNQFSDELVLEPFSNKKGCYVFVCGKQFKKIDFYYNEFIDDNFTKEYHLRYRFNL